MTNLFTFKYWFNFNPPAFIAPAKIILIIFLSLLLLGTILFLILKKKDTQKKKLFQSFYNFCFLNFDIGILLLFFELQGISFFSARFWYLLWFIFMIWSLFVIYKKQKKYLARQEDYRRDKEFKKYLP